jgi:GC-rich sequence DNA-binding factor
VITTFEAAISSTLDLIQQYTAVQRSAPFNPDVISSRKRFLTRRTKLLDNLLRWRKFTGERFGIGQLIEKLINATIMSFAEDGWDAGGEAIVRQVNEPPSTRFPDV